MTIRESDGRIVPLKSGHQPDGMKPSNIGAGKAARPLRDPDRAPPVLSDGSTVITRLDQIHQRAVMQKRLIRSGWEPDALTQLPQLVSETLHFLRFQPRSFHYILRWIILAGSLSRSFSRRICW